MKILLLFVLTALLTGCVKTTPDETAPEKPEPTAESTVNTDLPDETAPDKPEAAPITPDTPYTGDLFYYFKTSDAGNSDTYSAIAILNFDLSGHPDWWGGDSAIKSYRDETPNYESTSYPRMTKDRVIYPLDEINFKSPMGYTADGMPFVWESAEYRHPATDEVGTQYITSIQIDNASMVQMSFYGYSFDEDFENSVLLPLLTSCRTWTPETPLKLRFTTDSTLQSNPSPDYHIDLMLPDLWQWNNSNVANDIEQMHTNRYATKRMEVFPVTYTEPFKGYEQRLRSQGIPEPITGTTDEGIPYEIYVYNDFSEGEPLSVKWHFANFAYDGRYIVITFLTLEDDSADYFAEVTLPVIQSIHIETAE